jgi:hypothetical protein
MVATMEVNARWRVCQQEIVAESSGGIRLQAKN